MNDTCVFMHCLHHEYNNSPNFYLTLFNLLATLPIVKNVFEEQLLDYRFTSYQIHNPP